MSPAAEPLKFARAATLALAWCFAVISSGVGLNALIKSNQQKSRLRKLAPAPAVVYIDTSAWVPYMVYFTSRQAKVTAFIGTTQLPDSLVKSAEAAAGSTGVYKKISYLRLFAIFPWFTLFFSLSAAAVLFRAGGVPIKGEEVGPQNPSTTEKEVSKYIEKTSSEV
ncbi:hypothetical protein BJ912DRAFT_1058261 [Pholiota molesta]|nr:hypothetical protein BJ912DRAFT_1058261 [Pholiota molesta]